MNSFKVITIVVMQLMKTVCSATQFHVIQINLNAEIIDVFHIRGFVTVIEIVQVVMMNLK